MENNHKLQYKIKYNFKDGSLLKQALTHSSYANELFLDKACCNERLEFLGDAVLELIVSEHVFKNNDGMPEGEMTKLRASIVCESTLAYIAKGLDIGDYLYLGRGEDGTGGRERDSILSDALEALIGAIFLDGGFTNAKEFIEEILLNNMEDRKLFFDSKTILQEIIQNDYKRKLHYKLIGAEGPDHNKIFKTAAMMDDIILSEGRGRTKKAAEQDAAYRSLLKLQSQNNCNRREN